MASIKERIAQLTSGKGSSGKLSPSPSSPPAKSESPEGEIVWHGWLGKAGAGILSMTFAKRYCVLHVPESGEAVLSMYDSMSMSTLKGGRISLGPDATVSQADDKLQVISSCSPEPAGTSPSKSPAAAKPVNAKFKAASAKEAATWAENIRRAIEGRATEAAQVAHRAVSSTKLSLSEPSTPAKSPAAAEATPAEATPAEASRAGTTTTAEEDEAAVAQAKAAEAEAKAAEAKAAEAKAAEAKAVEAKADRTPAVQTPCAAAVVIPPDSLVVGQLASVAARLGASLGKAGMAAPASPLGSGSSQEEVLEVMSAIITYVESVADGTAPAGLPSRKQLSALEAIANRVEWALTGRGSGPISAAAGPASDDEAVLSRLEAAVGRLEVAAA